MTRYRTGDRVEFDGCRGEVIMVWSCGWTGQIVSVLFVDGSNPWIMAAELTLIGVAHARTQFIPQIVGGTDMEATS